jgi:hypothetical protein
MDADALKNEKRELFDLYAIECEERERNFVEMKRAEDKYKQQERKCRDIEMKLRELLDDTL